MKRIISVILALMIIAGTVAVFPIVSSAESLYVKKVVSVVYDDSGSMSQSGKNNKWAYANYAMQAFCGMLNSEDELYITYMSQVDHSYELDGYEPVKSDLSESGISGSVDNIRNHFDEGYTPFVAIDVAMDKLRAVKDTNEYTQYWLFVITDGAFQNEEDYPTDKIISVDEINGKLQGFAAEEMANKTHPQITYLAIGDTYGQFTPAEREDLGISVETASQDSGEKGIVNVMSSIADKVSGRSRLDSSDIKQIDSKTVQITSDIPLLNIAVLSQNTTAKVEGASYSEGGELKLSRSVALKYPEHLSYKTDESLVGGAFLINNGSETIDSGTYTVKFDSDVNLDNMVIMFEPALEVRMVITCNGEPVKDSSALTNLRVGDKISIEYKIYEVGTDNEVGTDLLPKGTDCQISISENGEIIQSGSGDTMQISDYELKDCLTKLNAGVTIPGFNPIEYSAEFTPRIAYTVKAELGSDVRSIKIDDIANNKDLSVVFTVYANGVPIEDAQAVNALNPKVETDLEGNSGTVTVTQDGKIIFTPNEAKDASNGSGAYDVKVTCRVEDATATETYGVMIANYAVVPMEVTDSIVKTEFFGNEKSAKFYITKDDKKLTKSELTGSYSVSLSEAFADLKVNVNVENDGTIVCTPYSDTEHKLTFWNWWVNWKYYLFDLPGGDMELTLSHTLGTASSKIAVKGESVSYIVLNVALPAFVELAIIAFLIYWLICYLKKPRFINNGVLYTGSIYYNPDNRTHYVGGIYKYYLKQYNTLDWLILPTMKPKTMMVGNVMVTPDYAGKIKLEEALPWYTGAMRPYDGPGTSFMETPGLTFNNPNDIVSYISMHGTELEIEEITVDNAVTGSNVVERPNSTLYYVIPTAGYMGEVSEDGRLPINEGRIICYTVE